VVCGAPVVCLIGGSYVAAPFGGGRALSEGAAAVLLAVVIALTLGGARATTTAQLVLVALLVVMIAVAVIGSAPAAHTANWTPFAPHGWSALGSAASVLMLSFVGWEAIAPLVTRLRNPSRQLPRIILTAFTVTAVVYLALAFATISVLGSRAGSAVPLADLLRVAVGPAGPVIAAAAAVVLTLAATNAYLSGAAALAAELRARRGPAPTGRTSRGLRLGVFGAGTLLLGASAGGLVSTAQLVALPTTLFLTVYLGCTAAATRLLAGRTRVAAGVSYVAVAVVLAFAGWALVGAVIVVVLGASTRVSRSPAGGRRAGAGIAAVESADLQPQVERESVTAPVETDFGDLFDLRQPMVESRAVDEQLLGRRLDVAGQVEKGLQGFQEVAAFVVLRDPVECGVQQVQDRLIDAQFRQEPVDAQFGPLHDVVQADHAAHPDRLQGLPVGALGVAQGVHAFADAHERCAARVADPADIVREDPLGQVGGPDVAIARDHQDGVVRPGQVQAAPRWQQLPRVGERQVRGRDPVVVPGGLRGVQHQDLDRAVDLYQGVLSEAADGLRPNGGIVVEQVAQQFTAAGALEVGDQTGPVDDVGRLGSRLLGEGELLAGERFLGVDDPQVAEVQLAEADGYADPGEHAELRVARHAHPTGGALDVVPMAPGDGFLVGPAVQDRGQALLVDRAVVGAVGLQAHPRVVDGNRP
jgi:amino acid efflux transporter